MMPFGGYFDSYYSGVISHAILSSGLSPLRADEIYSTGAIIDDIHKAILNSQICIADVTGRNPNVSYELGMAHALRKPAIIITQNVKDVPFDYQHLRIITYDPMAFGWEAEFRSRVKNTIKEVLKNPSEHIALRNVQTNEEKMRKHLLNIFYENVVDIDQANEIFCDMQGNALLKTSWRVKAHNPIYHLCHTVVSDKSGNIEVRKVYDKMNGRELEYVVISESNTHLSYFFLFKQFKKPVQQHVVETVVYVEGFLDLDRLIESGEVIKSTHALEQGFKFIRKADFLYLPKDKSFTDVYAEYLNHPRPSQVGKRISAIETQEYFLLKMDYRAKEPYQHETGAAIRLPK